MHSKPPLWKPPDRRNPSAGVHLNAGRSTLVLLTVTTKGRIPWLTCPEAHRLLVESWRESQAWLVGDYILMPDHLHCFCAPRDTRYTIESWITFWKSVFRKRHGKDVWRFQSRGWHHRLRNVAEHQAKWAYLRQNPMRARWVRSPADWPYQGRVFDLRW